MDMTQFSTEELRNDLAETIADIKVCELAKLHGVEKYGGKYTVEYRLTANIAIRDMIQAELERRLTTDEAVGTVAGSNSPKKLEKDKN